MMFRSPSGSTTQSGGILLYRGVDLATQVLKPPIIFVQLTLQIFEYLIHLVEVF